MNTVKLEPETPEEARWQSVLGEGHDRSKLLKYQSERQIIEQHVGAFVVLWARVDFTLGMAAATLANPASPGRVQDVLARQSTAGKIDFLKAVLPDDWEDGRVLVRTLVEGNTYRNLLAHGLLGQSGSYEGTSVGWHFNKGKLGQHVTELDLEALGEQTLKAQLIDSAVGLLMGEPFTVIEGPPFVDISPRSRWNEIQLADLVVKRPGTWSSRDERDRFRELAHRTFRGKN